MDAFPLPGRVMRLMRLAMQNKHTNKSGPGKSAVDILHRLSSADAGPAWVKFLDLYSALIMKTVRQFEYRQDRSSECFLYVYEQLNDDGFRRLLKFNTAGKVKFRTWLGTVVFNLCVDWHRREFGRVALLPAISALPAFDRAVYRLVIEQGMDKETSFQTLRADFPDLTRELIESAVQRVYTLLTPHQRWQVTVRNSRKQMAWGSSFQGQIEHLPDPGSGPEEQAQKQQDLDTLQDAMAHLPANQRLLLRLRFQEGLSLKKIAELTQLGDTNRAWRHVQAALKALFQHIHEKKSAETRKS
jgi:RNA polymerase sigma factor (sigma-70 family)